MQDILQELNVFLQGVTCKRKVPVDTLAQSALFLLQRVPAARHAVLEHFCYVFDDAAGTHIKRIDAGQKQEGWWTRELADMDSGFNLFGLICLFKIFALWTVFTDFVFCSEWNSNWKGS